MEKKLANFFKNKSILITGGTGSFGQIAVKKLLKCNPKKVIIFSRDELKQFEMSKIFNGKNIRYFLGDVRDRERLSVALNGVDYLIHAAALKHVPKAEYDPSEFIKTNIIGTENIIHASIQNKLKKIMLVSTDKAVNPINLYGSTKLCAEKLFSSSNNIVGSENIRFSISRYGNVINSRGSLIPHLFEKIKNKETINLTHPEMTRFFITLEDGVQFTLTNFIRMKGGEIFVPKLDSYKIKDIFDFFRKQYNIKVKVSGIREGEKINEVLVGYEESAFTLNYKNFYLIKPNNILAKKFDYTNNTLKEKGKIVLKKFTYSSESTNRFIKSKLQKDLLSKK